ncbi:hypothetical protein EMPS_04307 [Entomortierella parvispora]|uniref:Uncharacterized protein n=1 Tax=Entomortierella parvispora TaxID=205924 RepID=A0A9P3LVP2_9FUNG|nr:hypothetical protein EMPS_04307 [Entomortierella parvispora]
MKSLISSKESLDSSNTGTAGCAQANTNIRLNTGISFTNSQLFQSTRGSDGASVEFVEVIPDLKATGKQEEPQGSEVDSGGEEDEMESDSQEEFEEVENPSCINPDYLCRPDTLSTARSTRDETSPASPTPEAGIRAQNKESSVVHETPDVHSDSSLHNDSSPLARRSQRMVVSSGSMPNDRVSMTESPAIEAIPFNQLAFNASSRTSIRARAVTPGNINVGTSHRSQGQSGDLASNATQADDWGRPLNTNPGQKGHTRTFTSVCPVENRPIARLVSVPRYISSELGRGRADDSPSNIPRLIAPQPVSSAGNAAFGTTRNRRRRLPAASSIQGNQIVIATAATGPSTSTATSPVRGVTSIPIDQNLAPRLRSLQRWSNRVSMELTSRSHVQEHLADQRLRASDMLYHLGQQLGEISDLSRRLQRQQREIREREDSIRKALERRRGRRQE